MEAIRAEERPRETVSHDHVRVNVMGRLGRAMADGSRARILAALLDQPGYPAQLSRDLGLTRSNVSNHLTCLRGCGIVVAEPEGRQTRYEIADHRLRNAIAVLIDAVIAYDDAGACAGTGCTAPACCNTPHAEMEHA